MDKNGMAVGDAILALILMIAVVLALLSYGPILWDLFKISIGFGKIDANNINNSNCEGIGASDKPCDNFGQANSPKIIDIVEFSRK